MVILILVVLVIIIIIFINVSFMIKGVQPNEKKMDFRMIKEMKNIVYNRFKF